MNHSIVRCGVIFGTEQQKSYKRGSCSRSPCLSAQVYDGQIGGRGLVGRCWPALTSHDHCDTKDGLSALRSPMHQSITSYTEAKLHTTNCLSRTSNRSKILESDRRNRNAHVDFRYVVECSSHRSYSLSYLHHVHLWTITPISICSKQLADGCGATGLD